MTLETVKGFNKLTKNQQALFVKVNTNHMKLVGDKEQWIPIRVIWDKSLLKVWFVNGDWLHYTQSGEWY